MAPQAQDTHDLCATVILALGANQVSSYGNPSETLGATLRNLSKRVGRCIRKSHLYATPAFPAGAGPDFVNAAAAFETDSDPEAILLMCHELEELAQRTREKRWGQRTLDVDLIAYDQRVLPNRTVFEDWRDLPLADQMTTAPKRLVLPHPRLQDRSFVLVPMMDVAPDWMHPVLGLSTQDMLAARPSAEKATVTRFDLA